MVETPNPKRRRVDDPLDFIEKPSEDFHCPVTLEILTEPRQTLCCGNHLSQEAADRLKQARKPCPICNRSLKTMPDKFFKRQVSKLKVRCSKKALGCNWVGELGNLEKHLSMGSVDGECQYMAVTCPLSCGERIQRGKLTRHKSKDCSQRPYTCNHCGHKDTYKSVMKDHWPRCEKYPLPCPNNCGEKAIERQHLKEHVDETCPLHVIQCEYAYAGCKAELKRQLMPAHLDENVKQHLSMVSEQVPELQCKVEQQRKQIEALTTHSQALATAIKPGGLITQAAPSPVIIPLPEFVMTDFVKHKNDGVGWLSPPIYSHIGGYKLCITVEANGWKEGKGTHVGVAIHMMRGEYDNNLKWPFKGEVRVQLLNQRGDKRHIKRALLGPRHYSQDDFNESVVGRVIGREIAEEGRGYPQFIAHTDLAYNHVKDCQYLMNDCLKFRVTKIELAP